MDPQVMEQMLSAIRQDGISIMPELRLDQGETAFFLETLINIDKRVFAKRYAALMGKQIFPKISGVEPYSRAHRYREIEMQGEATEVSGSADDFPVVSVSASEITRPVQPIGLAYVYDLYEIKAAARGGTPLDQMRAMATRTATEQKLDRYIAYGNPSRNIYGLLTYDASIVPVTERVASVTPRTKALGGTSWGTVQVPLASGREMVDDVLALVATLAAAAQGTGTQNGTIGTKFRVVMPPENYALLAATDYSVFNETKALSKLLESPLIEGVYAWYACSAAASGGALAQNIMMAFPPDEEVIGHITPLDWTPMAPQQRNMAFVTNTLAESGGGLIRYQYAVRYMKGI